MLLVNGRMRWLGTAIGRIVEKLGLLSAVRSEIKEKGGRETRTDRPARGSCVGSLVMTWLTVFHSLYDSATLRCCLEGTVPRH